MPTTIPVSLLNFTNQLADKIVVLLCLKNVRAIQACRQTCHTLKTTIVQSTRVQYLERLALHGMHDPQILIDDGGAVAVSPSSTLGVLDRVDAVQGWGGGGDKFVGGEGVFFVRP